MPLNLHLTCVYCGKWCDDSYVEVAPLITAHPSCADAKRAACAQEHARVSGLRRRLGRMLAREGHESGFRSTWELVPEAADDPVAHVAYEYAATHKLTPSEMSYIGPRLRRKDNRSIEDLIAASSLGTPEVETLCRQAPPEVVDSVMRRVKQMDAVTNTIGYRELKGRFDGPEDELDAILLALIRVADEAGGQPTESKEAE